MPTDQGIMAYRRHIKKSIEELKEGKEPEQPKKYVDTIKTYGQDTVLKAPKRNIDDKKLLKSIGSHIMKLQFETENMSMKDRDQAIFKKLSEIEKKGIF